MSSLAERAVRRRVLLPGHFTQPVLIEAVQEFEDAVIVRVRRPDGGLEDLTLEAKELEEYLAKATAAGSRLLPARDVFGALEAVRIRLAYSYDPYFAVSLSGVRALPHQLEAVYERLLPQPRLRFILAHDPGAGKTVMAGLLIKELKLRGAVERVLILVPSPLTPQWQDELSEKFDETFEIVDSHIETGQVAGNVWQRKPLVIASLDYAKRDGSEGGDNGENARRSVKDAILQCPWDLVIVDEAHKASASLYGTEVKTTKRYRLLEELARSPQVHHMIFLTATPHQGKDDQFRLFLRLLDPDQFEVQNIEEIRELLGEDKCPFFMRRLKEDLRDFDGKPLFLPRNAWTKDFELSSEEHALYKAVNDYIQQFLGKTYSGRRRMAVALARSVLQRRLASSLHAITESLRRRLERLAGLLEEVEKLPTAEREKRLRSAGVLDAADDETDPDDQDDEDRDRAATELTVAETLDGLRREVAELRKLHGRAADLRDRAEADPACESKLAALKDCLKRAEFASLKDAGGKLLIFTEHRDTLAHLEKNLKAWGYSVVTIHGGHSALDRKDRRLRFAAPETQVLIATDAAGEGVNLQFCHLMVNYDVPWNPNRLEQRMGRIHRIGQTREVHVFNFVATNTEEGRVLGTLINKLQRIREDLKSDKIFDVIGTFLRVESLNLEELLRDVAINPKRAEDFVDKVEKLSKADIERFEKATEVALARRHLDLGHLSRQSHLHEDVRLMPEYVERFFLEAASAANLAVDKRADGLLRIDSVPSRFRSPTLRAVQRQGPPRDKYAKLTFRKNQREGRNTDADLISPGHPLYASVVELYESKLAPVEGGVTAFWDPRTDRPYFLHAFEVGVRGEALASDGRSARDETLDARFVPVMESLDGTCEAASQDILHDLTPVTEDLTPRQLVAIGLPDDPVAAAADRVRKVRTWVQLKIQAPMVKDQRSRRARDVEIRRDYLEKAFGALEHRLVGQENEARIRVDEGEQGAEGRLGKIRDSRQQLEHRRVERIRALERLGVARNGDVRHLATVLVLPIVDLDPSLREPMQEDPEVEQIAMDTAMAFERARNWEPEDVSKLKDGRGYDILSTAPGSKEIALPARRIEVKGRSAAAGDVFLTRNEWIKAERLADDYWLYVVYEARAGATPKVVTIQNPAKVLASSRKELKVVKGYILPGGAITKAAQGS